MAEDEDQNDIDISIIRTAIEISGNMIEQILKGIHYGSPEVRCLLYSECDYILECKVCRSLFRSLPNFVAHKRAYCKLAYQQSDSYLNLVRPDEETVVVHPEMPEETKKQKPKKSAARSLEKTVQQLKEGTLGQSAAYKLYSQAADKIEQQREAAKTQTLTFEPIPNTTKAMKVTVTEGLPQPMDETMSDAQNTTTEESKPTPLQSSPTATLKSMLLKSALEGDNSDVTDLQEKSPEKLSVKQNPRAMLSPPKKMTLRCKEGIKSMPWKKGRTESQSPEAHMDFNTLECLDCNSAFRSKKTLIIHYQNAHLGKRTFFPCPLCEHVFFYIFGLTRHLTKAHNKTKQQIDAMRTKLKKSSFVREVTALCPSAREQIQHVKEADTPSVPAITSNRSRSAKSDIIQTACLDGAKKEDHVCSNCGREFAKKLNLLNHRKICLTEGCTPVTHTITKSVSSGSSPVKTSPGQTIAFVSNSTKKSPISASAVSLQNKCTTSSQSTRRLSAPIETILESASRSLRAGLKQSSTVNEDKESKPSVSKTDSKPSVSDKNNSTTSIVAGKVMVPPKLKTEVEVRKPLIKTTSRKKTGFKFSARVKSPPPPTSMVLNNQPEINDAPEIKPRIITTSRSQTSAFSSRVAAPPVDIDELIHSGFSSSCEDSDGEGAKPDIEMETQDIGRGVNMTLPSVKIKTGVVEEIWVDKLPGLPTEKVRSNRTYVMKNSAHQKLECQDMKRLREVVNEQQLQCMHCYQEFSNISNLRRHAIRHLGWKRYKCKMCKFSSYNKSECTTHLVRTHSVRFRNVSSINNLIVDLGKEGSRVRLRKKQQTLFEKQAAECAEAGEDVYVTDQRYKRKPKDKGSEETKVTSPVKKRGRGEKGIETPFNISTRNSPREFDIRPYKKLDPQSTLCTRKSAYPKKITVNTNVHDESNDDEEDTKSTMSQSSQTSRSSKSDSFITASQGSQKTKTEISDTDSEVSVRGRNRGSKNVAMSDSPQTRRAARVGNESSELKAARNLTHDLLD